MKISYILQLKDFSIMLGIGFLIGIIYGVLNTFKVIKSLYILQIIADILFSITVFFTFIWTINQINLGEFRLFLLIGFLLGIALERITLGKLFAKTFKYMYTMLIKFFKKFNNSTIGRIIFK